jgi:hypothetical protein
MEFDGMRTVRSLYAWLGATELQATRQVVVSPPVLGDGWVMGQQSGTVLIRVVLLSHWIYWERMERAAGIEPATSSLGSWHSTAELRPL